MVARAVRRKSEPTASFADRIVQEVEQVKAQAWFDKALDQMNPDFITCRDLKHAWYDFGPRWEPSFRHYRQCLKCTRCSLQKIRIISKQGFLIDAWYESYPPGYLMPQGTGRMSQATMASLRLRSIQNATLHVAQ